MPDRDRFASMADLDDGTIGRHAMKWGQIVAHMAEVVRSLEVTEGCAMHEIAIRERRRRTWALQ